MQSKLVFLGLFFFVLTLVSPLTARADDGGISFGGLPHLLSGHPSVAMQSEVVRMTIGKENVKVDCQFVFHNSGPACTVRMGFPDQARGSEAEDDYENAGKGPAKGAFISYTSYVDGMKVPTTTIHGDKTGDVWHAKTVSFGANATRHVRDVYTVPVGGQITEHSGSYSQAFYVLRTGASWHGAIGRATVIVTFQPGAIHTPLHLVRLSTIPGNNPAAWTGWNKTRPGTVVYRGPSTPTVQGRTLTFVRTNLKPAYLDDILLYFGYRGLQH